MQQGARHMTTYIGYYCIRLKEPTRIEKTEEGHIRKFKREVTDYAESSLQLIN